jgi:uncharacterized protein
MHVTQMHVTKARFVDHKIAIWAALIKLLSWGLLLSLVASAALAEPKFPALTGRVVDGANLLSPAARTDLELKLKGLEDATSDQLVVVTLNSLEGYDIADYGYQLGRTWGIGQSGQVKNTQGETYKDNGVLLIVAPNERKIRIEVGYGLEPVLTDAMSSVIIQQAILPAFKQGNFEAGIVQGADAIISQLSLDRGVAIQKAQAAQAQMAENSGRRVPSWIVILLVLFFVLFSRGWLPFLLGSALGGGFGGGGSSGGW